MEGQILRLNKAMWFTGESVLKRVHHCTKTSNEKMKEKKHNPNKTKHRHIVGQLVEQQRWCRIDWKKIVDC